MTRKLLVIGGSGFIGSNLISNFKNKYTVTSVSKSSKVKGVVNLNIDLTKTDFAFLSKGFDACVYLGTVSSPKEAEMKLQLAYDTNVTAVQKFLEKARQYGIKKIILFSSAVLYSIKEDKCKETDKLDQYGSIYNYSKYLLETLATYYTSKHGMEITVFRLSNTYGPGQNNIKAPYLIPGLFEQAIKNKKIEVWNITPVRDWVYIDDVATVISRELETSGGGIFNLGTGQGKSVGDVVKIISTLTSVLFNDLGKKVSPPYKVICDMSVLKSRIGYIPDTSLEDGLKKTLLFYKNYFNKK